MDTPKSLYWKNGYIFRFNTNKFRVVWNDNLIDGYGYIPKGLFNEELVNTDSTINEHVIEVYAPNYNAHYFEDLLKCKASDLLWSRYDRIVSREDVKKALRLETDNFIIL